jgi:hypothetical protein
MAAHAPKHVYRLASSPYGIMMLEFAIALGVGFALGYGVRDLVSRRRHWLARQRGFGGLSAAGRRADDSRGGQQRKPRRGGA